MKSIGTSTQTNRRRLFSRAAATLLALGVANAADAQPSGASDVKLKKPNVLLLLDTSGSMYWPLAGNGYTPSTSNKPRWTILTETLTGSIQGLGVTASGSSGSYDSNGCRPVQNRDQKINRSLFLNGETSGASGAAVGPYTWPMANGNVKDKDAVAFCLSPALCDDYASWNGSNICRQGTGSGEFHQSADGLIDSYRERIRFGVASFDPQAGGNLPCQLLTDGSMCPSTSTDQPQFSYWNNGTGENWLNGLRTTYAGDVFAGSALPNTNYDLGIRNTRGFPWHGRLIGFGPSDWDLSASGLSGVIDCTDEDSCTGRHNDMVQQSILGLQDNLQGSTPLAAMMRDAYEFVRLDTLTDGVHLPHEYSADVTAFSTLYGKIGPRTDPYYTDPTQCRQTNVILVTDGEPSNDLSVRMSHFAGQLRAEGVKTYVVGIGLPTATWIPAPGPTKVSVPCDSLTSADLAVGSICEPAAGVGYVAAGNNGLTGPERTSIRACCNLLETAVEGGTARAYFPTNQAAFKQGLSGILGSIAGGAVSRTVPVFSGVAASFTQTGGSTLAPATSYELRSSMELSASSMWTGNLERVRSACDGSFVPVIQNVNANLGDVFGRNLAAGPLRRFFTVGTANADDMKGSLRDESATPVNARDGLFATSSALGEFERLDGNDTPATYADFSTKITALFGSGANDLESLLGVSSTFCQSAMGTTSLPTCANRFIRWYGGDPNPDDGGIVSSDPVPSRDPNSAQCNGNCSPLGAIFRTMPIVVPPPSRVDSDDQNFGRTRTNGSTSFVDVHGTRPTMVYSQTVDGQLHAFVLAKNNFTPSSVPYNTGVPSADSLSNNELWSFIPPAVIPALPTHFNSAGRLLDGQLAWGNVVYERPLGFTGTDNPDDATDWAYNTVVVGCSGVSNLDNGFCYALDVTDPTAPRFLWQLSTTGPVPGNLGAPLFGKTVPGAAITHIRYAESPTSSRVVAVAVIPGGAPDTTPTGTRARRVSPTVYWDGGVTTPRSSIRDWGNAVPSRSLTFVELKTGRILARLVGELDDSPSQLTAPRARCQSPAGCAAFDSPLTGIPSVFPGGGRVAERIYVGDADGAMWRVDVTHGDPSNWKAHIAFDSYNDDTLDDAWDQSTGNRLSLGPATPQMGQPIETAPLLSTDGQGDVIVTFSTGKQENFNTANAGMVNFLISFADRFNNTIAGAATNPALTGFQARVSATESVQMAWRDGGSVTGPINLFDGQLYFAYFNPAATNTCSLGTGGLCGLDYATSIGYDPKPSGTVDTNPAKICKNFANGEVVFGVSLNLVNTCTKTNGNFSDPWMSGNYSGMTSATAGRYELVFQTGQNGGTPTNGGRTNRTKIELPQPRSRTSVRSFVRVAETEQ